MAMSFVRIRRTLVWVGCNMISALTNLGQLSWMVFPVVDVGYSPGIPEATECSPCPSAARNASNLA